MSEMDGPWTPPLARSRDEKAAALDQAQLDIMRGRIPVGLEPAKRNMTPGEWMILLHIHVSAAPLTELLPPADWQKNVLERFVKAELIEPCDREPGYMTTSRGAAYVEAVCNLPFPECKWEIPA